MHTSTSLPIRLAITSCIVGAVALIGACSVDATNPIAGVAGVGSLGAGCTCPNSASECSSSDGQCQSGLVCRVIDDGQQVCTHNCPCPLNFVCKALGSPQSSSCVRNGTGTGGGD